MNAKDKLILTLLSDVCRRLNGSAFVNLDELDAALSYEYEWAFPLILQASTPGGTYPSDVQFVMDVMDMFSCIDDSFNLLSATDQALVSSGVPLGIQFRGFDQTNEIKEYNIAQFLIKELGWHPKFSSIHLNSHTPKITIYQNCLDNFKPLHQKVPDLTAQEIINVFK